MPVTKYIWDPVNDCVLQETDENGVTQVTYNNEPVPYGRVVSEHRNGETKYYHYDALGSTRQLTDDTETVTDTFTYDAWGNEITRTGDTPTPYRWVGELGYQFDPEIDSYYVRARTYEPVIARWWSIDLNWLLTGDGLYAYVRNNPARLFDPSGRESAGIAVGDPVMKSQYFNRYWETQWIPYSHRYPFNLFGYHKDIFRLVDYQVILTQTITLNIATRTKGEDEDAPLLQRIAYNWVWPTKATVVDGLRVGGVWNPGNKKYLCRKFVVCEQKCKQGCTVDGDNKVTEWTAEWAPWQNVQGFLGTSRCREYVYGILTWDKLAGAPYCDPKPFGKSWDELTKELCPSSVGEQFCEGGEGWEPGGLLWPDCKPAKDFMTGP